MHKSAAQPGYVWESGAVGNRRKESSRTKVRRDRTGGQGPAQGEGSVQRNEAKVGLSKVGTGKRIGDTQPAAVETVGADCDGDGGRTGTTKDALHCLGGWESGGRRRRRLAENYFYFLGPASHWHYGTGSGEWERRYRPGATGQWREEQALSLAGSLAFSGLRPPVGPSCPGGCPGSTANLTVGGTATQQATPSCCPAQVQRAKLGTPPTATRHACLSRNASSCPC